MQVDRFTIMHDINPKKSSDILFNAKVILINAFNVWLNLIIAGNPTFLLINIPHLLQL
jgi:hypothetical protein